MTEDQGVITVRFQRPAKRNAINPAMTAALVEATNRLGEREDLRVMLITAEGDYFTAGIDLAHPPGFVDGERLPSDIAYRRGYRRHHLLYDEFESYQGAVTSGVAVNLLGRVPEPEDVASVIVFLCRPESRQITGQVTHTSARLLI